MTAAPAQILVFSENTALLAELIGKAQQAARPLGWEVTALLCDEPAPGTDQALAGASVVYRPSQPVSSFDPVAVTGLLCRVIAEKRPALVLIGATRLGLEAAPRAAERIQADYAAWVTGFDISPDDSSISASTMLYSGVGSADYHFQSPTVILTAAQGVFEAHAGEGNPPACVTVDYQPEASPVKVTGYSDKPAGGASLEQAEIVIDLGQGVKPDDDRALINELAGLLGGQLACTRPVASERNWFPDWLGLSGMKVSPKLCLTLGVSGAIQHIIGIRSAQQIVSVNNDEGSAIFSQSDYGITADLYEFLPVLVERIKARGVRPC